MVFIYNNFIIVFAKLGMTIICLVQNCTSMINWSIVNESNNPLQFSLRFAPKCALTIYLHWFHTEFTIDYDVRLLQIGSKQIIWIISFGPRFQSFCNAFLGKNSQIVLHINNNLFCNNNLKPIYNLTLKSDRKYWQT